MADNVKASEIPKKSKRSYISQSDIPKLTLSETIRLAQCLYDDFAGKAAPPHQLAMSADISPTSSNFRDICGASIAYGLTEGGYNSQEISLSQLGKRVVAPTSEGDDVKAKVEATLRPKIIQDFFTRYNRAKLPSDRIALNVLQDMGVPQKRLGNVFEIIKRNGEYVGIIHQTKTGPYIAVDTPMPSDTDAADSQEPAENGKPPGEGVLDGIQEGETSTETKKNNKVFISHGKNHKIVEQIKEILTFGKFSPVVSIERESLAVPVPDKVFEDMRSCAAGVINVAKEGEFLDPEGNRVIRLNENVLIEIGAAIALYKKNFVLLVEKGVELPSNLQGLYRCEYEGDKLDYDATIKLLKTFNEFNLV
jgi:hypothetical protein